MRMRTFVGGIGLLLSLVCSPLSAQYAPAPDPIVATLAKRQLWKDAAQTTYQQIEQAIVSSDTAKAVEQIGGLLHQWKGFYMEAKMPLWQQLPPRAFLDGLPPSYATQTALYSLLMAWSFGVQPSEARKMLYGSIYDKLITLPLPPNRRAMVEMNKGISHFFDQQTALIGKHFEQAVAICDKEMESFTPAQQAQSLVVYMQYVNYLYGNIRDFDKALIYIEKGIKISQKYNLSNLYEFQNIKLRIYQDIGDRDRALEENLAIVRRAEADTNRANNFYKGIAFAQIGDYYASQNNNSYATRYYMQATNALQLFDTSPLLAYWLNYINIGKANTLLNTDSEYLRDTVRALLSTIVPDNTRPEYFVPVLVKYTLKTNQLDFALNNLSYQRAQLELETRAPSPVASGSVPAYLAVANLEFYRGNWQKALQYYERLEEYVGLRATGETRLQLNTVRDPLQVLALLSKKIQLLQRYAPQTSYESELYVAIELLDKLRMSYSTKGAKELLLNDALFFFDAAMSMRWKEYQQSPNAAILEDMFLLSEKTKATLLLDALRENNARSFGNIPDSLRLLESSLQKEIAFAEAELAHCKDSERSQRLRSALTNKRQRQEALKKQLESNYPNYYQYKYAQKLVSMQDIQTQLPSGMGMIEYFINRSSNELFIFVVTADQKRVQVLPFDSELLQRVHQFLNQITDTYTLRHHPARLYRQYTQDAHLLYKSLFEPVRRVAQDAMPSRWVVIPDGVLHYLPLEILLPEAVGMGDTTVTPYEKLNYLIRSYSFSYSYSATLWSELLQRKTNASRMNVLGVAPSYTIKPQTTDWSNEWNRVFAQLSDLKGTKEELDWIASHWKTTQLADVEASEANFKREASDYALIHLAMHGVLNDNPAYSGLYFTYNQRDTTEDNILFAYEIPALELNAELVVLSACETGYGKYQYGEGVISMGRGFMYAGVPSVINSLWAVNDQASVIIIQHFYQNLQAGMSKDEALRQAKLSYLAQSSNAAAHPFCWAPFVLQGNPNPLSRALRLNGWWVALGALTLGTAVWAWRRPRHSSN